MTVASTINVAKFSGSGSSGPFTFGFRFFHNTEILVEKIDAYNQNTLLDEVADYTLVGAGELEGGSVTLLIPLESGEVLTIRRLLDYLQDTAFVNQGAFYPQLHEDCFDRIVMMLQQLNEMARRAIKVPIGEVDDFVFSVGDRTNTLIGFDAGGNLALLPGELNIVNLTSSGAAQVSEADATAQDITVNLPASGEVIVVKKDSTTHVVTIQPTVGGQTIGGLAESVTLEVQGQSTRLIMIGSTWYVI